MHELGIIYQIIKTVDEVKQEQGLTEIQSIRLDVGEMCDVVPKFLEEAWQSAKDFTAYPNAKLELNIIPATARCTACNYSAPVKSLGITCPKCGSSDFKLVSGREFDINKIVAK